MFALVSNILTWILVITWQIDLGNMRKKSFCNSTSVATDAKRLFLSSLRDDQQNKYDHSEIFSKFRWIKWIQTEQQIFYFISLSFLANTKTIFFSNVICLVKQWTAASRIPVKIVCTGFHTVFRGRMPCVRLCLCTGIRWTKEANGEYICSRFDLCTRSFLGICLAFLVQQQFCRNWMKWMYGKNKRTNKKKIKHNPCTFLRVTLALSTYFFFTFWR